ncbi:MAG: hypothetical protein CR960_01815 [Pasteurellales bacterium]|nr:MAG: hypothetical protein CR960_01815 [Pasteurellales bacterium]
MFGNILGSVASSVLGGNEAKLPQIVQTLLASQGGIQGLITKFQQGGLDDVISSWMGNGENQPVSPDQIKEVLGEDELRNVAQQVDMDENELPNLISQYLPTIVDKLSPNGEIDTDNLDLESIAKSVLGSFLK